MKRRILVAGAGGHGKVVARLIVLTGRFTLAGTVDRSPKDLLGLPYLGSDDDLPSLLRRIPCAAVGLGSVRDNGPRRRLRLRLASLGFSLPALVHPSAVVDSTAVLGDGAQVMAGAVVNPGAVVGMGAVVNTGAVVEHDGVLGDDAFVGPRAALSGGVHVGAGAFIGIGVCVREGVRIGPRAVVGAGAAVVSDVPADAMVVGVPARPAPRR